MIAALLKMRSGAGPGKGPALNKYPGSQLTDCL